MPNYTCRLFKNFTIKLFQIFLRRLKKILAVFLTFCIYKNPVAFLKVGLTAAAAAAAIFFQQQLLMINDDLIFYNMRDRCCFNPPPLPCLPPLPFFGLCRFAKFNLVFSIFFPRTRTTVSYIATVARNTNYSFN